MDINTTQQFNINQTSVAPSKTSVQKPLSTEDTKFADELTKAGNEKQETPDVKEDKVENKEQAQEKDIKEVKKDEAEKTEKDAVSEQKPTDEKQEKPQTENEPIDTAIDGLKDIVTELNKISQKEENFPDEVKPESEPSDNKEKTEFEDNNLIDNNMNIQEPTEKVNIQTETGTNFSNNGQPFAEFINKEQKTDVLRATEKELAEEKAVLSTMEENIAIANKNMLLKEKAEKTAPQEKVQEQKPEQVQKNITVQNEEGIKKVDAKTHLTIDTIVSYENVVMDKADVDFFVNLVENGSVNMSDVQSAAKSAQVSKTLADLLAKAMNENKPVRIDFDNDISVIIKIDRAGKISADFLPSSQIAEAYLRENLPLLRQKFNDNNIDYNELNQRKQKQDTQDNRKKGRKDE